MIALDCAVNFLAGAILVVLALLAVALELGLMGVL
jgi:hypothetical protein